jgi:hypothetical protein
MTQTPTITVGDVVKVQRHRYVVTETYGPRPARYSADGFDGFGAQQIRQRGFEIQLGGRTFKVDEQHRWLSVSDVLIASRNGRVIYRRPAERAA